MTSHCQTQYKFFVGGENYTLLYGSPRMQRECCDVYHVQFIVDLVFEGHKMHTNTKRNYCKNIVINCIEKL